MLAMPALVQLETGDGTVLFEGEFSEAALQEIAVQDKVEDVIKVTGTTVSQLATTVRRCTKDLLAALDDLTTGKKAGGSFSNAVIELGVSVSGEGNVIVARGSAQANLKVTLTWDFS
jgi:Trypsin-co-occurring domain 1